MIADYARLCLPYKSMLLCSKLCRHNMPRPDDDDDDDDDDERPDENGDFRSCCKMILRCLLLFIFESYRH